MERALKCKPGQPGYATRADWMQHRDRIGELYSHHTLPDVIKIMYDGFGFRATAKMFKDRLRQWGMDNKNKRPASRKARCPKARSSALSHQSLDSCQVLLCEPNRPELLPATQGTSYTRYQRPQEILSACVKVEHQQRMYVLVGDYFKSSISAGTWVSGSADTSWHSTKSSQPADTSLNSFLDLSLAACHLFRKGSISEGERVLVAALAPLSEVARSEHPKIIPYLISVATQYSMDLASPVAQSIIGHVTAVFAIVLGTNHPLTEFCSLLVRVWTEGLYDICHRTLQVTYETSASVSEPMSSFPLELQMRAIAYEQGYGRLYGMAQLLRLCDKLLGALDRRTLRARSHYSVILYNSCDYNASLRVAQKLLSCTAALPLRQAAFWRGGTLRLVARIYYTVGQKIRAKTLLEDSILLTDWTLGRYSAVSCRRLHALENWLESWGDLESAAKVRADRLERIDHVFVQAKI